MAPVMAVILTQALDREMTVGPKLLTGEAKDPDEPFACDQHVCRPLQKLLI